MKLIAKGNNDVSIFDSAYMEVFKLMLDPFKKFLSNFNRRDELIKLNPIFFVFFYFLTWFVCLSMSLSFVCLWFEERLQNRFKNRTTAHKNKISDML